MNFRTAIYIIFGRCSLAICFLFAAYFFPDDQGCLLICAFLLGIVGCITVRTNTHVMCPNCNHVFNVKVD